MRKTLPGLLIVPLTLLSFSALSPAKAADVCIGAQFQCNGFEPNWQFTTGLDGEGDGVVRFIDPENPDWQTSAFIAEGCVLSGGSIFSVGSGEPLSLSATIVQEPCTTPADEVRNYSVSATFNQGALTPSPNLVSGTGCCIRLD